MNNKNLVTVHMDATCYRVGKLDLAVPFNTSHGKLLPQIYSQGEELW